MKKRMLSLLLTLTMVLAMLPVTTTWAASEQEPDPWVIADMDTAVGLVRENIGKIIPIHNGTTADELERELKDLFSGNVYRAIKLTIKFSKTVYATTEKEGSITCTWSLSAIFDHYSTPEETVILTIPVMGDEAKVQEDIDAMTAALNEYFATAKVDKSDWRYSSELEKACMEIMEKTARNCIVTKYGGISFSSKNGHIRIPLRLILGGRCQPLALDATIHDDGSVTLNSLGDTYYDEAEEVGQTTPTEPPVTPEVPITPEVPTPTQSVLINGKAGENNMISAGTGHTAAIDENGTLWMWGGNNNGEVLGNDTSNRTHTPVKVMENVAAVSCGLRHFAVIKTDGTLWMWGSNTYGQLGIGGEGTFELYNELPDQKTPVKVLDNVAAVSCGDDHTAAIKTDGTLWMWGSNLEGKLGNGGEGNATVEILASKVEYLTIQTVPVKVMDNVAAVSCSYGHTAAIKTDGTLWTWGWNRDGQLGNGGGGNAELNFGGMPRSPIQTVPVQVLDNVAAVSCGDLRTAAIKADGSLWMWGSNEWGQLGNGTTKDSATPVKVMDNMAAVSCGENCTAALKTDGTLWMWGSNSYGKLGNGSKEEDAEVVITGSNPEFESKYTGRQTTPIKVLDNVAAISCKQEHIVAVKADGTLWAWGLNTGGQLGIGGEGRYGNGNVTIINGPQTIYQTFPVQVTLGDGAVKVKLPQSGDPTPVPEVPVTPEVPTANPTNDALKVDGKPQVPTAYKIGDANYFQLRDVAMLLNGTKAQFSVDYDEARQAVVIVTGQPYTPNGYELQGTNGSTGAMQGNNDVYINGEKVDFAVYKIGGANFFQIRALGQALGFNVGWSAEQGMFIESDKPYDPAN